MSNLITLFQKYFRLFLVNVLKRGPIPKHVAFVLDGNRRWAADRNLSQLQGHAVGFAKSLEFIDACLELGITEMSMFMFGIENLKRTQKELDNIFFLLTDVYNNYLVNPHLLNDRGVRVQLNGNINRMPEACRNVLSQLILMTKDNDKFSFNICNCHSGLDEITDSVDQMVKAVQNNTLSVDDIHEKLIGQATYVTDIQGVDLMIRTSGVSRISDFLSWHLNYSTLQFFNINWPDIRVWHLYQAVAIYQLHYDQSEPVRKEIKKMIDHSAKLVNSKHVKKFLTNLENQRQNQFEIFAKC